MNQTWLRLMGPMCCIWTGPPALLMYTSPGSAWSICFCLRFCPKPRPLRFRVTLLSEGRARRLQPEEYEARTRVRQFVWQARWLLGMMLRANSWWFVVKEHWDTSAPADLFGSF